jgi:hypothetical protein
MEPVVRSGRHKAAFAPRTSASLAAVTRFLVSVAALLALIQVSSAAPQEIDVPLTWVVDEGRGPGDTGEGPRAGRRLAVLLVDRSGSMQFPHGQGSRRWDAVVSSLTTTLEALEKATPGIEVEIRFFDNLVDCETPMKFVLAADPSGAAGPKSREVVNRLRALGVPRTQNRPKRGGTALHEAVSVVAEQMSSRFTDGNYEWGFFAVYSDGVDQDSAPEFRVGGPRDWLAAARKLSATVSLRGGQVVVVPVGPEADKMVSDGTFSGFEPRTLGASLPKPPPPPCRLALEFKSGFDGAVSTGRLLGAGETVLLNIATSLGEIRGSCGVVDITGGTELVLSVSQGSPFRIEGSSVLSGAGGIVRCTPTGATDQGAVLRLQVMPRAKRDDGLIVRPGALTVSTSFRPAVAPPDPSLWRLTFPRYVKIGDRAVLSVDNLDDKFNIAWTLNDGGAVRAAGASFAHAFNRAGVVSGVLEATSADGKKGRREFEIEVIDGSFEIAVPSKVSVGRVAQLAVRNPKSEGATYRWQVDGMGGSGETFGFTSKALGEIQARCVATTAKGGFTFEHSVIVVVSGQPRIVISEPDSLAEGAKSVKVICTLSDIEGDASVQLSLDGRALATKRPEPAEGGLRVVFEVPLGAGYWRTASDVARFKAEVVEQSLSDEREVAVIDAEGLGVQMRSPTPGTVVPFGANTRIELEVSGPSVEARGLVESIRIRVTDATGRSVLLGDGAGKGVERAAPDFSVSIQPDPAVHRPPFRVEAKLEGSSLKPRTDWLAAGELGAEIAKASFSITTVDGKALEATAYEPLSVLLNGLPPGEKASVEWAVNGNLVAGTATTATLPGRDPGSHEVVATVVRGDGSRVVVGPVTLFCRSSLRLQPPSSAIAWSAGAPPDVTVELVGAPDELRMVESVEWIGATAVPGAANVARATFDTMNVSAGIVPLQVTARVSFRGTAKPPEVLVATYSAAPSKAEITRFEVAVGGNLGSDRSGGAVIPTIETTGVVEGDVEVRYSYRPSEKARQRGFAEINDEPLPKSLLIRDDEDGAWTFEATVKTLGSQSYSKRVTAFENKRRLDWLFFGVFVAACWTGLAGLLVLASNNGGLWWGVRFCDARRAKQSTSDDAFTRPYVIWSGGADRPRWSLLRKQARYPIVDVEGGSALTKPNWRWMAKMLCGDDAEGVSAPTDSSLRTALEKFHLRWTSDEAESLSRLNSQIQTQLLVDLPQGTTAEVVHPSEGDEPGSQAVCFQRTNMRSECNSFMVAKGIWWLLVLGFPLALLVGALGVL